MPADVRELVREDGFELRRRQPGERARGQQDDRPQPADDGRHFHERRSQQADGARDVKLPGEPGDAAASHSARGAVPRVVNRCTKNHPASRRRLSASTPVNQTMSGNAQPAARRRTALTRTPRALRMEPRP